MLAVLNAIKANLQIGLKHLLSSKLFLSGGLIILNQNCVKRMAIIRKYTIKVVTFFSLYSGSLIILQFVTKTKEKRKFFTVL